MQDNYTPALNCYYEVLCILIYVATGHSNTFTTHTEQIEVCLFSRSLQVPFYFFWWELLRTPHAEKIRVPHTLFVISVQIKSSLKKVLIKSQLLSILSNELHKGSYH